MALKNALPVKQFPGFKHTGVVSPDVQEIVVTFNAESLDALSAVPESDIAWANVGTRVNQGHFKVKVPIRLPSGAMFTPFNGTRSYNKLDLVAPVVEVGPLSLNYEWPMVIGQSGVAELVDFYGVEGLAGTIVDASRAYKALLVASIVYEGFTNAALGVTAKALTYKQPGYPDGLPLFVDGSGPGQLHYSHPVNGDSATFYNLFLGAGKITDSGVFGQMLLNMSRVPHPVHPNMTMGNAVTDIVGPTHMLIAFFQTAIQNLSLQIQGAVGAATTNIYRPELIEQAMQAGKFVGASGLTPWRFWIAPQLDNHPYLQAAGNANKHMWLAICNKKPNQRWAELAAPNKEMTPFVRLFGDEDPTSIELRQVRMISDLDAGGAAGLPHFAQMYFEDTPS